MNPTIDVTSLEKNAVNAKTRRTSHVYRGTPTCTDTQQPGLSRCYQLLGSVNLISITDHGIVAPCSIEHKNIFV